MPITTSFKILSKPVWVESVLKQRNKNSARRKLFTKVKRPEDTFLAQLQFPSFSHSLLLSSLVCFRGLRKINLRRWHWSGFSCRHNATVKCPLCPWWIPKFSTAEGNLGDRIALRVQCSHVQPFFSETISVTYQWTYELEKDRVVFLPIHGNFGKTYWAGC